MSSHPNNQVFETIFGTSPIGIAIENMDGQPVFVNAAICSMLGFNRQEMHSKHCVQFSPPEDAEKDSAFFQQLRAGSIDQYQLEKRYFRGDGSLMWGRLSVSRLQGSQPPLLLAMVEDITDKRTAEDRDQASFQMLESVTSQMAAGLARCSRDFRYVWVNQRYADWTRRAPNEIVGRPIAEILGAATFESLREGFQRVLAGEAFNYEREVEYQNLGKRWITASYKPTFDGAGAVDGWVSVVIDVTDRKRGEAALRESEHRFRVVADSAPVLIWMSGTDKLCNYFNKPWLDFTGRSLEQELGNGWADGVHPADLQRCLAVYTQSFDRRERFSMEYRLRRRDGEYRWIYDIGVPRWNNDGSFAGYIGSCVDTTERKNAEEALTTMGQRLIEAQEEERAWIARELHDDITQQLALLAVGLDDSIAHGNDDIENALRDASRRILEISRSVQTLSHRLHSAKLEYLGLVKAAASFCEEVQQKSKVEVNFNHSGVPALLPKDVSLCLFRVLQEALQNAIKYSGERRVEVNLCGSREVLELTVSDHGSGFDVSNAFTGDGLGLISMRERMQIVRGQLKIESQPGKGTIVRAQAPLALSEYTAMAG